MKCGRCGGDLPRDKLKCVLCNYWNTGGAVLPSNNPVTFISDAVPLDTQRISSGPWDEVFGGGLVPTTVFLIAGEPGAGKSTLALTIADRIGLLAKVGYLASEETASQIADRANRMKLRNMSRVAHIDIRKTGITVIESLQSHDMRLLIVDSLHGLVGKDLDMAVVHAEYLKTMAEKMNVPILVIDHVNKQNEVAGLKRLQHVVDASFLFLIKKPFRVLAPLKNRFGPTNVDVQFDMTEHGLVYIPKMKKDET